MGHELGKAAGCSGTSQASGSKPCRLWRNRSGRGRAAGRGMAVGDLFNDGKLDAVINVMDGHPVLLRT